MVHGKHFKRFILGDIAPGLEGPTPAHDEITARMVAQEHELIDILGKEHKEPFFNFQSLEDERLCLEQVISFSQGFRLGARLILAAFDDRR